MNSDFLKTKDISKAGLLANQLILENETWKRTLEFLTEEDVNLKTRLSEILKTLEQSDQMTLDKIEHLYNRLLSENEILGIIGIEVSEIGKQLLMNDNRNTLQMIQEKQKKIREEMEAAELRFHNLKFDFNNYFSEILQIKRDSI